MLLSNGDKVTYHGYGRPYLNNSVGTVVDARNISSIVEFHLDDGRVYKEYVGNSYLKKVEENSISSVRDKILSEIRDTEKQISVLRKKISGLNAANKALKNLEGK